MNIGLVTGFIVGGMLLLSLLVLNNRISMNSAQTAMSEMTRQSMSVISETVNHDLRRMGLGTGGNPITHASANRLIFNGAQMDNLPATVEWRFDTTQVAANTANPRERILYRIVNDDTTRIEMGVVGFDLTYFNSNGDATVNLNQIRRIRIGLTVESRVPIGTEFSRSFWEADITPRALQN